MLSTIIRHLADAQASGQVHFHLIGGYGLDAHRLFRDTRDLDVLIAGDSAAAIQSVLIGLGYVRHDQTPSFLRYWHPTDTGFPPVDVMMVNAATFARISSDAVEYQFQGVGVTCPSVASFIALKLHALKNNPSRTQKDLGDIISLIEKNPGTISMEQLKALCDRYAPSHIYEKLRILIQS